MSSGRVDLADRTRGTMTRLRVDYRTAPRFSKYLGALAAQLFQARSDGRKVVSGTRSGALVAQLLHACADPRKIVGGAGLVHVSSVFLDSDVITRSRRLARSGSGH